MDVKYLLRVVEVHYDELNMPIDCHIKFFDNSRLTIDGKEKVLLGGDTLGVYIPSERTAYVRLMDEPLTISTIAHECAHDFLIWNTKLGKELIKHDMIIRKFLDGSIDAIVDEGGRTFYTISRFVNEGFASFIGRYVLYRYVHTTTSMKMNSKIDFKDMNEIIKNIYGLVKSVESKPFDYYYGRQEFEIIANEFGIRNAIVAGLMSMDIEYSCNPKRILDYYFDIKKSIYDIRNLNLDDPKLVFPVEIYTTIPHFRLLLLSRILPKYRDRYYDVHRFNDIEFFVRLVSRAFGDSFINKKVDRLYVPVTDRKLGYLLGKYLFTRDSTLFRDVYIPTEIKNAFTNLELNPTTIKNKIEEVCNWNRELMIGYLLAQLEHSFKEETLRKLASLGLSDVYEIYKYKELGADTQEIVKDFIRAHIEI